MVGVVGWEVAKRGEGEQEGGRKREDKEKQAEREPWPGGSAGWRVVPHAKTVAGLIPSQSTHLGCAFESQSGCVWEGTDQCFSLTSVFLSLSFCLSQH